MTLTHDTSTLKAAIQRNFDELNNAILKLTAHNELARQKLIYVRMSFFAIVGQSLYNDMLAHTMRVLDEHKQSLSFWYVLRCNEAVVNKAALAAGLDLNELKHLSTKLKSVRDQTHFHIDRKSVKDPKSIWKEANITGATFAMALQTMAVTLAHTKKEIFGGELETVTDYDGSDIAKIVKAYESVHSSVHGAHPSIKRTAKSKTTPAPQARASE